MFVGVIISVMYKFFGHIHSVMLNWSNDLPSIFFPILQSIELTVVKIVIINDVDKKNYFGLVSFIPVCRTKLSTMCVCTYVLYGAF